MSTEHDDDPVPRDAWLREALRHAPDADVAPPHKVSDIILRMGRAAVAPRVERAASAAAPLPSPSPSGGSLMDSLAAWWAWLARPPVAAGLAGLMVATVVGVMWAGRTPDEVMPPQEIPVAAAPAPQSEPAPAAATPGLPESARVAAASPRQTTTAPADAPARKAAPAAPKLEAPIPAAPTVAAAPPAPAPAQNAVVADAARARESLERRELAAAAGAAKSAAPAAAPQADATAPGALTGRAAAASTAIETPGLSNLRFEIRRKPEAWSWQRDEGEQRAMDDAMQNWIALADRSSRTAWQLGATGSDQTTTTLRFTRDGVVRAVMRIGPAGMRLTRGGKTESAELSRGVAATLLSSLDALGP